MEDNIFQKLVKNVKNKLDKKDKSYPSKEYAFSLEEINNLSKDNKEKIIKLKENNINNINKDTKKKDILEEVLSPIEGTTKIDTDINIKDIDIIKDSDVEKEEDNNSYVNLSKHNQSMIMNEWKNIDINEIDKDIIEGKDLINHNYTGIYADEAMRYIHNIRKKYEVVINYLIGFNNEKKGINNKTFFSNDKNEEWKYLSSYIKVLEKIKNNK